MAVITNRNQDSYETIEGISGRAQKYVKQAVKAVGDTAAAMAGDAKQQVTGDFGQEMEQGQTLQKTLTSQQQQQVQDQGKQLLDQTRMNLERINSEIKKVRQEKEQKKQQQTRAEDKKQEQKKEIEEKKKQEDPVWKKMLRKGSHEAQTKVSG